MDKYDEVALQIVDVTKENFSDSPDSNHKLVVDKIGLIES